MMIKIIGREEMGEIHRATVSKRKKAKEANITRIWTRDNQMQHNRLICKWQAAQWRRLPRKITPQNYQTPTLIHLLSYHHTSTLIVTLIWNSRREPTTTACPSMWLDKDLIKKSVSIIIPNSLFLNMAVSQVQAGWLNSIRAIKMLSTKEWCPSPIMLNQASTVEILKVLYIVIWIPLATHSRILIQIQKRKAAIAIKRRRNKQTSTRRSKHQIISISQ